MAESGFSRSGAVPRYGRQPSNDAGGGGGDGLLGFQMVSDRDTTVVGSEVVAGGGVVDPSSLPAGALFFEVLGRLTDGGGGTVTGEIRLYDMGAPGAPIVPVRRSTLSIATVEAGDMVRKRVGLTVTSAAGVGADEVLDEERIYEARVIMPTGGGGDAIKVHWAGMKLNG